MHRDGVCGRPDAERMAGRYHYTTVAACYCLKAGDTFECSLIIEGEPLYLDHLKQDAQQTISYVCGKKNWRFV